MPKIEKIDPFILFKEYYAGIGAPFSMAWKGRIKIEKTGRYVFLIKTNGSTDLFIDNKKVMEVLRVDEEGKREKRAGVYLKKGFHDIMFRYWDERRHIQVTLSWIRPGEKGPELVPYKVLYPE